MRSRGHSRKCRRARPSTQPGGLFPGYDRRHSQRDSRFHQSRWREDHGRSKRRRTRWSTPYGYGPLEIQDDSLQGNGRCHATGEPTPLLQQTMHRMDGTSFEAEFRAIPISYAGQPAIQFVMRDITERKRRRNRSETCLLKWHSRKKNWKAGRSPYGGIEHAQPASTG